MMRTPGILLIAGLLIAGLIADGFSNPGTAPVPARIRVTGVGIMISSL